MTRDMVYETNISMKEELGSYGLWDNRIRLQVVIYTQSTYIHKLR